MILHFHGWVLNSVFPFSPFPTSTSKIRATQISQETKYYIWISSGKFHVWSINSFHDRNLKIIIKRIALHTVRYSASCLYACIYRMSKEMSYQLSYKASDQNWLCFP